MCMLQRYAFNLWYAFAGFEGAEDVCLLLITNGYFSHDDDGDGDQLGRMVNFDDGSQTTRHVETTRQHTLTLTFR